MLQNEPLVAIVAVDTAENEPLKVWAVSFHYFIPLLNTFLCLLRNGRREVTRRPEGQQAWQPNGHDDDVVLGGVAKRYLSKRDQMFRIRIFQ